MIYFLGHFMCLLLDFAQRWHFGASSFFNEVMIEGEDLGFGLRLEL